MMLLSRNGNRTVMNGGNVIGRNGTFRPCCISLMLGYLLVEMAVPAGLTNVSACGPANKLGLAGADPN